MSYRSNWQRIHETTVCPYSSNLLQADRWSCPLSDGWLVGYMYTVHGATTYKRELIDNASSQRLNLRRTSGVRLRRQNVLTRAGPTDAEQHGVQRRSYFRDAAAAASDDVVAAAAATGHGVMTQYSATARQHRAHCAAAAARRRSRPAETAARSITAAAAAAAIQTAAASCCCCCRCVRHRWSWRRVTDEHVLLLRLRVAGQTAPVSENKPFQASTYTPCSETKETEYFPSSARDLNNLWQAAA